MKATMPGEFADSPLEAWLRRRKSARRAAAPRFAEGWRGLKCSCEFLSFCADEIEHRQDDVANEDRVKEPIGRQASQQHSKEPATKTVTEAEAPSECASFQ